MNIKSIFELEDKFNKQNTMTHNTGYQFMTGTRNKYLSDVNEES